MGSVFSAKPAILFKLQPFRGSLFIFCARIIFSFTVRTCKLNDHSHNTLQPLLQCDSFPPVRITINFKIKRKYLPPQQKSKAHDRDWTDDLFLTKEVLHHWATWAQITNSPNPEKVERETGLEPATLSLEGWRSSQLSYSRKFNQPQNSGWGGEDSNLRRLSRQIYSLFPLATREPPLSLGKNTNLTKPSNSQTKPPTQRARFPLIPTN